MSDNAVTNEGTDGKEIKWRPKRRRKRSISGDVGDLADLATAALDLGVERIIVAVRPTRWAFELIVQGYREARTYGAEPPRGLLFSVLDDERTIFSYTDSGDWLRVNVEHRIWKDPAGALEEFRVARYLVSDDPLGMIYHEIGHALHRRQYRLGVQWWDAASEALTDDERQVAERVSVYATLEAGEFVAEVFAGMLLGITFDDEIMALYSRLRGPTR